MTDRCQYEDSILRALRLGTMDDERRRHLESCSGCAGMVEIAALLLEERRGTLAEEVPPAGALWLRMQLRTRRESAVRSSRTVSMIQGASLAGAAVLIVAIFGFTGLLGRLASVAGLAPSIPWALPLLAVLGVATLVAPIAVAVAFRGR